MPSGVFTISSCAWEPGTRASSKPSPISTPLIAWMPISAPARRASSLRSQWTCEPRPTGTPYARISTTPPRVSPSLWAWSISATIAFDASASRQRTGSASSFSTSAGVGYTPCGAFAAASSTTWLTISIPAVSFRYDRATAPRATRAAVSRAEARSRIGPGLVEAVLLHARQVGVPGPGAGQRGVAGQTGEDLRVDRVGRHDLLPLRPLGVAHHDRHRRAHGQTVPHTAEEGDLVALELHPRTAPIAQAPPGQVVPHHLRGDRHAGGKTLQRRDKCGTVGLPRGQPAQPAQRCSSVLAPGTASCLRVRASSRTATANRVRGPGPPPPILPRPGREPGHGSIRRTAVRGAPCRLSEPTARTRNAAPRHPILTAALLIAPRTR